MVNGEGKRVWRYTRKEISLNTRVFLWQLSHHAFGFDNSEIIEHWDLTYWENEARRNPMMDTGYGCSYWTLQFGDLGSDNQNSFPVSWFWPHLGSADAQAPDSPCRRGLLTQLCCAALLLPDGTRPHTAPPPHSHLFLLNSPHSQNSSALWKLLPPNNLIKETSGNL